MVVVSNCTARARLNEQNNSTVRNGQECTEYAPPTSACRREPIHDLLRCRGESNISREPQALPSVDLRILCIWMPPCPYPLKGQPVKNGELIAPLHRYTVSPLHRYYTQHFDYYQLASQKHTVCTAVQRFEC